MVCVPTLHLGDFFKANVGKYSSTMDHMGDGDFPSSFGFQERNKGNANPRKKQTNQGKSKEATNL